MKKTNLKDIKKELKLTNKEIANMFGYKSEDSYKNSSAKKRIEIGIVKLYNIFKQKKTDRY